MTKRGSEDLKGNIVVDSGVLIELAHASKLGQFAKRSIELGNVVPYTTRLSLAEVLYILCRRLGVQKAAEKLDNLLRSGYIKVEEPPDLYVEAGRVKCERAISLADSYIIALASSLSVKATFARREYDIVREMEKKPFKVEVIFLEDILSSDSFD